MKLISILHKGCTANLGLILCIHFKYTYTYICILKMYTLGIDMQYYILKINIIQI